MYCSDLKAGAAIAEGKCSNRSLTNRPTRLSDSPDDNLSSLDEIFLSRPYFCAFVFNKFQMSVWNFCKKTILLK